MARRQNGNRKWVTSNCLVDKSAELELIDIVFEVSVTDGFHVPESARYVWFESAWMVDQCGISICSLFYWFCRVIILISKWSLVTFSCRFHHHSQDALLFQNSPAARAALDNWLYPHSSRGFSVKELDFVPSSNRAGGSEDNLTVMVVQFGGKHQMTTEDSIWNGPGDFNGSSLGGFEVPL